MLPKFFSDGRFLAILPVERVESKTIFSYNQALKLFCKYLELECEITDVALVKEQHIRGYFCIYREEENILKLFR